MTDNLAVYQGALGDSRPNDVAISADGTKVYAAGSDGNLSVFSTATGALLDTWHVGTQLGGMDISPDGTYAVVTELVPVAIDDAPDSYPVYTMAVYKVDLATGAVVGFTYQAPDGFSGYTFWDAAVLNDGKVLLSEQLPPGWSGWPDTQVLDLNTGQFTQVQASFSDRPVLSDSPDGSTALIMPVNISDAPLYIYQSGVGIVASHDLYEDGVAGFNWGVQAYNSDAGLVAQSMGSVINIYDGQLHYQFNLSELRPELNAGGVAGLAFDANGQFLFILNDQDDAIYQVSTSDWSVVGEFSVGADISSTNGDFGNRLLVSPDMSFFTVVTENGLVVVDPTASPPATEDADTMLGTSGDDVLDGLGGNDIIKGLAGSDTLDGSGGNDTLVGGTGSDTLNGGDGSDALCSGAISPTYIPVYGVTPQLDHGTEVDTLNGGGGDDTIFAGYGDNIDGGDQDWQGDSLYISFQGATSGVTADFSLGTLTVGGGTITGIENVIYVEGGNYGDYINTQSPGAYPYAGSGALLGLGGDDTLIAGSNTVLVDGGDGDDTIYTTPYFVSVANGGEGNDTIYAFGESHGGNGNDTIVVGESYYAFQVTGDGGDDSITGNSQDDTLAGNDGDDSIDGGGGNDVLTGNGGADTIQGGDGDDILSSGELTQYWGNFVPDNGAEHDVLSGGAGDDRLEIGYGDDADGGDGTDTLRLSFGGATSGVTFDTSVIGTGQPFVIGGGTIQNVEAIDYLAGSDFEDHLTVAAQPNPITVDGAGGDDWITAEGDSVTVIGGDGNDRIDILSGQATIYGGDGTDSIYVEGGAVYADGGSGDDFFFSGAGADTFSGGDGNDRVAYTWLTAGVTVNLSTGLAPGGDQLYSIENVDGTNYADKLTGDYQSNYLSGRAGNDTLEGLDGDDILDGGAGNDVMRGGDGNDLYFVNSTSDIVTELANQGIDEVHATINYKLGSNVENGVLDGAAAINLTGNSLNNDLRGNEAANTLNGGAGDDILDGMGGADTLVGSGGNDIFIVDNAGDIVTEGARGGTDEVLASMSYTLGARVQVEKLTAIGDGAINLTGNELAQTIQGNDFANVLSGAAGIDTLIGGGGADTLYGGAGNDILWGGDGADRFAFQGTGRTIGNDRIMDFQSGVDKIDLDAFGISIAQVVATVSGSNTILAIDSNHDGHSDFTITLVGVGIPGAADYIF